jgi:Lar family restriction alleviation protein
MEELKNCPFCGSESLVKQSISNGNGGFYRWVHCEDCNANGSWISDNISEIEGWNSRPIEDALQRRIDDLESKLKHWKDLLG